MKNTKKTQLWIETFSGRKVNPLSARGKDIEMEDIAHSLAMQCRFNGHCRDFYSVAEHCVNTAAYVGESAPGRKWLAPLFALLHDASEAYLCDIPRPLKWRIRRYLDWERSLSSVIFAKFAGRQPDDDEWDAVMEADNAMLSIEAAELAHSGGKSWNLPHARKSRIKIRCLKWGDAKRDFLKTFVLLREKRLPF